jgi:retinol dehydrogenase-12
MAAFLTFLRQQLFATIPVPEEKHTGQTMIVTGANVGLGFEAARHLTRLDAKKVILACRNIEKGEAAKKSIEETTQRRGVVEVWQVDLSSYESVKQFARRVEGLERLDAIIENAAIATQKYQVFEGNESTLSI